MDQSVVVAVGNDTQFLHLCQTMGRPELATDPRFVTTPDRVRRRDELTAELNEIFKTRNALDWVEALDAAGVPCGPIYNIEQMLQDPQIQHRGVEVHQDHPLGSQVRTIANPIKFSETPVTANLPPPMQGQHTKEVLADLLHMDDAQLEALRAAKVI